MTPGVVMHEESRQNGPSFPAADWQCHEELLWQFEHAWRDGNRPQIEDYLDQVGADQRDYCLRELVMMDLEYQWENGCEAYVEDYTARYRQLLARPFESDGLLAEELRARRRVGKLPTARELAQRFPQAEPQCARLLQEVMAEESCAAREARPSSGRTVSAFGPRSQNRKRPDVEADESSVSALRLCSGFQFDQYVLREQIGAGAFAVVWRATDSYLHRNVAIKVLRSDRLTDEAAVSRMVREARAAARLQHPSIVQIFDVGEIESIPFIVSQYVDGPSLREALDQREYAPREAADIARRIAIGLDHAHRLGIVHRDVKPANILLTSDGRPLIADFGLAHQEQSSDPTLTHAGDILGSPAYMAPEQARGDIHLIDARADIYAVGAILYQLLTGVRPFLGGTASVIHAVIHDRPVPLRKVNARLDRDLETIVEKCLEKEPEDRYHSARQLADDLRRYLDGISIVARPAGPSERLRKWIRRNPRSALLVACLVAVLGFSVGTGLQLRAVGVQRDRARAAEAQTQRLLAMAAGDAGTMSMQRGRFDEAIQHFDRSISLHPPHEFDLHFKRIEALVAARRIDAAQQAISDPSMAVLPVEYLGLTCLWKAQVEFEKRHADPAEKLLAESQAHHLPADEKAYVDGMLAAESLVAVEQFQQAIRLNPMHHRARRMLVTMLIGLARFDEALDEILTARQLYVSDTDFGLLESLVRSALGQPELVDALLSDLHLTEVDQLQWRELCGAVRFLTHNMAPGWHEDAERVNEIVQSFVERYRPLLADRGIQLPPKITRAFDSLSRHVDQYAKRGEFVPLRTTLDSLCAVHPEGSLFVLLGELQLMDKPLDDVHDVDDAFASFKSSLRYPAYLPTAHLAARSGIVGVTLYKVFRFHEDKSAWAEEFAEALRGISPEDVPPELSYCQTFARGALQFDNLHLAEVWVQHWATAVSPDASQAQNQRREWSWLQMTIERRRENWLSVLEQSEQFLADFPEHDQARQLRDLAVTELSKRLDANNAQE